MEYLEDSNEHIAWIKIQHEEKIQRTQKYINHLKRENDQILKKYEGDNQWLHNQCTQLELDYETLQQQNTWELRGLEEKLQVLQNEKGTCINCQENHEIIEEKNGTIDKLEDELWILTEERDYFHSKQYTNQVKKFDPEEYYTKFGAPYAQSANEKIMKNRIDGLENSKTANEQLKKDYKKRIKFLEEEVEISTEF